MDVDDLWMLGTLLLALGGGISAGGILVVSGSVGLSMLIPGIGLMVAGLACWFVHTVHAIREATTRSGQEHASRR